jgi:hypothetical protein
LGVPVQHELGTELITDVLAAGGASLRVSVSLCVTLNKLSHLVERGIVVKCTEIPFSFDVVSFADKEHSRMFLPPDAEHISE